MELEVHQCGELNVRMKRFKHGDGTFDFDVLYLEKDDNTITLYFDKENDIQEFATRLFATLEQRIAREE